jgi:hypothetical protein
MRRALGSAPVLVGLLLAGAAVAPLLPRTTSSFTASASNSGNEVTAAPDWTAPDISAMTLQGTSGGSDGIVTRSETFYVYAAISDSGAPASGVGAVVAHVEAIATTATASLSPGSWTIGATTYNFRSAALTARTDLTSGTHDYSVDATDRAGNGPSTRNATAQADTTAFAAASIAITSGGSAGKPSAGDVVAFTFNRAPDPGSVLPEWNGDAVAADVKMADGGLFGTGGANDLLALVDPHGQVTNLGYVATNGDFVVKGRSLTFPGSIVELAGTQLTITLGNPSESSALRFDTSLNAPTWYPGSGLVDAYGNVLSTPSVSGAAARLF